ncbi:autoinducer binding domain-containing protein [Bradyrhizobium sp. CB82]|nr:autoinducer binding domain-containing protein [Bradyrhizobium sp. CB82]WFU45108.1 autoinducer binding domain-containing protein [Bradyrhizobium sp. CB82]
MITGRRPLSRLPVDAALVQRARDFGILDGFLIPVASTAGRTGQIWFGGRTLDRPEQQLPALHLMAIYAFDRTLKLHGSPVRHQANLTLRKGRDHAWTSGRGSCVRNRTFRRAKVR